MTNVHKLSVADQIELLYVAIDGRAADGAGFASFKSEYHMLRAHHSVARTLIHLTDQLDTSSETLGLYPWLLTFPGNGTT